MRKLHRGWRVVKDNSLEYWFPQLVWWPLLRIWRTSRTAILIGARVLAVLALYSRIVYFSGKPGPVWDWWNTLISTLASVALAIVAGFILFRLQTSDTSQEEEHEMENLLHSEVSEILVKLEVFPGVAREELPNVCKGFCLTQI